MEKIAKKRGCIMAKGEIDYNRVAVMLLDEFRGNKLGNITLEWPEEEEEQEEQVEQEAQDEQDEQDE
jgi:ribosome biogenesis GTPase A